MPTTHLLYYIWNPQPQIVWNGQISLCERTENPSNIYIYIDWVLELDIFIQRQVLHESYRIYIYILNIHLDFTLEGWP